MRDLIVVGSELCPILFSLLAYNKYSRVEMGWGVRSGQVSGDWHLHLLAEFCEGVWNRELRKLILAENLCSFLFIFP
jgi:hypothetical protein